MATLPGPARASITPDSKPKEWPANQAKHQAVITREAADAKQTAMIAAWKELCDSGKYKSVLTTSGKMREHYGLTEPKEFFAEMTERYFGSNDFYPIVTGELKQAEPETFALLAEIWGPLPGSAP